MAQDRDERPSAAKRASETAEDPARREDPGRRTPTAAPRPSPSVTRESVNGGNGKTVPAAPVRRREQYLIGTRNLAPYSSFGPPQPAMDAVVDYLRKQENVEVIRRVKQGAPPPFVPEGAGADVVIAKIEAGKAQRLAASAPPHIIIERDAFLSSAEGVALPPHAAVFGRLQPLRSVATDFAIRVTGVRDQPLAGAMVTVYGPGLPAQALTDDSGLARISYFGGPSESLQALFVKPAANFWDRFILAPRLSTAEVNTLVMRPLSESFVGFPNERLIGWGQRLMHLDHFGGRFTGRGVRIGIIDSGCDSSHPLLQHISHGKDFTSEAADSGWKDDVASHGTHCAGIISAASAGQGVVGFAPEAELHIFKVFPGGRVSDLLAALQESIERELDIININVDSAEHSELVAQKVLEARQKGIACIAAAGSSPGLVGFPAILPTVMAVGAVGKLGEFPADSGHAHAIIAQLVGGDEIFPASFTGTGPQVAVSAPGVAIVSTAPEGGYVAADGTSVAASHVCGMAALILAHHPLFQEGPLSGRSEQRVLALLALIRASAVPHFLDPQRAGAGVPDLQRVTGEQTLRAADLSAMAAGLGALSRPDLSPAGWQTVMQLRAAGLI
jgi:subtilisin